MSDAASAAPLALDVLPGAFAVCRLAADAPVPAWGLAGPFSVVARTADELSVICDEARVPAGVRAAGGWRLLELRGPFAFDEVGVLLRAAAPLAAAGVSIMPVATFDTDYVLVPGARLADAVAALRAAGHAVADASPEPAPDA